MRTPSGPQTGTVLQRTHTVVQSNTPSAVPSLQLIPTDARATSLLCRRGNSLRQKPMMVYNKTSAAQRTHLHVAPLHRFREHRLEVVAPSERFRPALLRDVGHVLILVDFRRGAGRGRDCQREFCKVRLGRHIDVRTWRIKICLSQEEVTCAPFFFSSCIFDFPTAVTPRGSNQVIYLQPKLPCARSSPVSSRKKKLVYDSIA